MQDRKCWWWNNGYNQATRRISLQKFVTGDGQSKRIELELSGAANLAQKIEINTEPDDSCHNEEKWWT